MSNNRLLPNIIAGLPSRFMRGLARAAARLRQQWHARQAYEAFGRMDPRMLADIGADRTEMFYAAYGEDVANLHAANGNRPQHPPPIARGDIA